MADDEVEKGSIGRRPPSVGMGADTPTARPLRHQLEQAHEFRFRVA
jgi:hypothetical protein